MKIERLLLIQNGFLRKYGSDIREFIRIVDLVVCTMSFYILNYDFLEKQNQNLGNISLGIITIICISTLSFSKIYSSQREFNLFDSFILLISRWTVFFVTLSAFAFVTRTSYFFSRFFVFSWALFFLLYLLFVHIVGRQILKIYRNNGGNSRKVLYIGNSLIFNKIDNYLLKNKYLGIQIEQKFIIEDKIIDCENIGLDKDRYFSDMIFKIKNWLLDNQIDMIWFDDKELDSQYIDRFLLLFGDMCLPIYYFPSWYKSSMTFNALSLGPFRFIEIWRRENSKLKLLNKRIFDFSISFLLIVILSPILILISILILFDSKGPVIFKQFRYGLDGKSFKIYKFRTMVYKKEKSNFTKQAVLNDPRVTRIGKFLRASSLDELPQLINVLKGNMSLVGPRPHAVDHNEHYRTKIHGYMQRHACKPGMTGLAQIRGFRGNTESDEQMQKRINSDLEYLSNFSIKEDLIILLKTFFHILKATAF